jgi:hypothetical protein
VHLFSAVRDGLGYYWKERHLFYFSSILIGLCYEFSWGSLRLRTCLNDNQNTFIDDLLFESLCASIETWLLNDEIRIIILLLYYFSRNVEVIHIIRSWRRVLVLIDYLLGYFILKWSCSVSYILSWNNTRSRNIIRTRAEV